MVTQYGMSSLGPVVLGRQRHEVFLGRDLGEDRNYSDQIAFAIDEEVRKIVDECYRKAKEILLENLEILHACAGLLLEKERINRELPLDKIADIEIPGNHFILIGIK